MRKAWVKSSSMVLCVLLILVVYANFSLANLNEPDIVVFDDYKVIIKGNTRPFNYTIKTEQLDKDRHVVHIHLHSPAPALPPAFAINIKFPKENINQLWNSQTWSNKSFFSLPSYDRAAASFAIISGLTINDQNQITFTCKDDYEARFANAFVQENGDTLVFGISLFEDNPPLSDIQDYKIQLLLDVRNIHFSNAIFEASKWRLSDSFTNKTSQVDTTKAPVYSTWYPMHRNIPLENITRELDSLKNFNFKSILVDDGWRSLVKMTVDTSYTYSEESLQTMQAFDKKRKEMGLKLYLWYSLPFMGGNPVVSQKYAGKYIHYKAPAQLHVLDPRYADVRRHLISTYINFYKNWQFDGFLFDFINHFYPKHTSSVSEDLGRDYVDVSLALQNLSQNIYTRLKSINADIFLGHDFESVGPNRGSDQNLLGGFVGVNSIRLVREKMVNNRLLYGRHTPFIEIMGVHNRDKSPDVARKFQSVMFGNPYLSFYNTTMPRDNSQTIKFWLNYWETNYEVLMQGDFKPMKVSRNYPAIKVENESKTIYTLYEDYTLNLPLLMNKELDVINAKESQLISFISSKAGIQYHYSIYNHSGESIEDNILKTKKKNTVEFLIPEGGLIRFHPMH